VAWLFGRISRLYDTRGSLEELKENLKDIYNGLTSGAIPCVRKVAELEVA